ncbi:DUF4907 domain-containing protein [uncultured Parabacteroides sp.]|uniref:DUF4907 domain-containing protein n=1 Tax=uncultured Parabacteroides sp. TaxID=512312 RepID=UPI0028054723|nr:DUF4907 domain-containing protein [uncultured Parabacteroides sp.]
MMRKRRMAPGSLIILLPLLLILFCFRFREMGSRNEMQPELQTFQLGDGWGYKVLMNKKVMIYQPTIPAIDSLRPFPSEASARRIGSLVVERIKKNQCFSITTDDIIHSLSD